MTHGIDWDEFFPTDEDSDSVDISEAVTEDCPSNEDNQDIQTIIIETDNEYNT